MASPSPVPCIPQVQLTSKISFQVETDFNDYIQLCFLTKEKDKKQKGGLGGGSVVDRART